MNEFNMRVKTSPTDWSPTQGLPSFRELKLKATLGETWEVVSEYSTEAVYYNSGFEEELVIGHEAHVLWCRMAGIEPAPLTGIVLWYRSERDEERKKPHWVARHSFMTALAAS